MWHELAAALVSAPSCWKFKSSHPHNCTSSRVACGAGAQLLLDWFDFGDVLGRGTDAMNPGDTLYLDRLGSDPVCPTLLSEMADDWQGDAFARREIGHRISQVQFESWNIWEGSEKLGFAESAEALGWSRFSQLFFDKHSYNSISS